RGLPAGDGHRVVHETRAEGPTRPLTRRFASRGEGGGAASALARSQGRHRRLVEIDGPRVRRGDFGWSAKSATFLNTWPLSLPHRWRNSLPPGGRWSSRSFAPANDGSAGSEAAHVPRPKLDTS